MPRARSASATRGSSDDGNGTRTGGRAGKFRIAVTRGPVVGEVRRSSRISPSTAPLYHGHSMRPAYWLPPVVWMGVVLWLGSGDFSSEETGFILGPLLFWLFPLATPTDITAWHGVLRK